MKKIILSLFLTITFFTKNTFAAPTVIRGPYLQQATEHSIIIKWKTDQATDSAVRYGDSVSVLSKIKFSKKLVTDHKIKIKNLKPNSKYFYSVGTKLNAISETNQETYFRTHPELGNLSPIRIWILGDSGRGTQSQVDVYQGYLKFAERTKRPSDFWLMLGDNAYDTGTDLEYQTKLFDIYKKTLSNTVLWPTLGNHDGGSASSEKQSGPYYDIFSLPKKAQSGGTASNTEAYYSFDYGNAHIICLNSYDVDRLANGTMANWLKQDLANTKQTWKIAYWHHPAYSKGHHDSDTERELVEMRENIVPILEQSGVDVVYAGHSHDYERTMLLNGHYGNSKTLTKEMILNSSSGDINKKESYTKKINGRGTVYVVAGTGALYQEGPLNHPAMKTSLKDTGSVILDITANSLNSNYIDINGNILDSFNINKIK